MKNKMLAGTFWMSFGSIFSRVLGILYLIPWLLMFGSQQNQYAAQALFNSAYNAYALFLALGTSGFPTAISRKIAIYNSENRFYDSRHLFKAALAFMTISGLICGALFYFFAPLIAAHSPVSDTQAATLTIRALVPALVILPVMSVIRGWFQGNQDLKPFGISQLFEQLARIIFIMLMTYLSFNLLRQSLAVAVAWSTFAAFVGAVVSLVYLWHYYQRKKSLYQHQLQVSLPAGKLKIKQLFWQIIQEALPFVYVGSGITLGQLIDQFTFKSIMQHSTNFDLTKIQNLFTLFSANPTKITTVIISLAMAISGTTLPLLASSQTNHQKATAVIQDNFRLLFGLLAPATIILALLAGQINTIFFGYNAHGGWLLFWSILMTFIQAVFTDVFTMVQSLGKHRLAVTLLTITLILKLVLQYPLVYFFHDYGALLATALAFAVTLGYCLKYLMDYSQTKKLSQFADLGLLTKVNLIFAFVASILFAALKWLPLGEERLDCLFFSMIFGIPALLLYLGLAYWYGLPQIVLKLNWKKKSYKHF
ncbi:putative polysaccharide biosynthesis protein [Liquorilactobacillus sicerae]|uniref:putative polysaccharide biosynthesis protein n=1 Tax=Liquorilactobacillus sicerae TaxID=1416943 RepID=UPI0024800506|nr:polysaccharide biosynthesis protein [Liquorilactobacillus sicerae]